MGTVIAVVQTSQQDATAAMVRLASCTWLIAGIASVGCAIAALKREPDHRIGLLALVVATLVALVFLIFLGIGY